MSKEPDPCWQDLRDISQYRREKRSKRNAQRVSEFDPGEGWTKHHETHWSTMLLGDRLQYWPGTQRWHWRGRSMNGNVFDFIEKRTREGK